MTANTMRKKQWMAKTLRKAYESHMASLDPNGSFNLIEELPSGTMINHLRGVDLDELKSYVRRVFVDTMPPCFHIKQVDFQPAPQPTKSLLWRIFNA